jgi:ABC-2 type transport system permease protein
VTRLLRSELLKISTTRTTAALTLGMIALVLLFSLLGGFLTELSSLQQEQNQRDLLGAGEAATLFAVLVGLMLVTSEFRHGTIRPTLLYEPRRELVVAVKAVAGIVAGAALGLVASAVSVGVGLAVLAARDVDRALAGAQLLRIVAATAAVCALWGAIGVGLGALVRHQVGAIVSVLAYLLVVDGLVRGLAPSVGKYLPGAAGAALVGSSDEVLSAAAGGLLLVAYAAVVVVAGAAMTRVRDVG